MGFSQKTVALLVGKHVAMLSRYERGRSVPPLSTALKLGIILRVPVEFLFPRLYDALRHQIRRAEDQVNQPIQQRLI